MKSLHKRLRLKNREQREGAFQDRKKKGNRVGYGTVIAVVIGDGGESFDVPIFF